MATIVWQFRPFGNLDGLQENCSPCKAAVFCSPYKAAVFKNKDSVFFTTYVTKFMRAYIF